MDGKCETDAKWRHSCQETALIINYQLRFLNLYRTSQFSGIKVKWWKVNGLNWMGQKTSKLKQCSFQLKYPLINDMQVKIPVEHSITIIKMTIPKCKSKLNWNCFPHSIISVKAKSFADREIRYTLKAQGHQGAGTFNIGPSTGIVKLAKELDFEDLRHPHVYQLIVTATEDSGGFSTTVEVSYEPYFFQHILDKRWCEFLKFYCSWQSE